MRSVRFRVDSGAYAVVAHLDADGLLRIVYPATPDSARVLTNAEQTVTFRVPSFRGAAPGAAYSPSASTTVLIASRGPLALERVSNDSVFEALEVEDYLNRERQLDEFARMLSGNQPFRLEYVQGAERTYGSKRYDDETERYAREARVRQCVANSTRRGARDYECWGYCSLRGSATWSYECMQYMGRVTAPALEDATAQRRTPPAAPAPSPAPAPVPAPAPAPPSPQANAP